MKLMMTLLRSIKASMLSMTKLRELLAQRAKLRSDRLIFSTPNANSIPNKLDDIRTQILLMYILVISESKLDQSFPVSIFYQ